ncbi:MAG: peroxide stress protein YaaA [Rickettsiales bacterium]|nr:peroxide stress protein YaaA [Rickettsiales bacterium]
MIILSPAKKLDFEPLNSSVDYTQSTFISKTDFLSKKLKSLRLSEIKSLMKISDKLSQLNFDRIKNFTKKHSLENSKQAAYAFKGDTYVGLKFEDFDNKEINYAQKNLRILSGFYGVLKPLDLIQPYRLEMGTKIEKILEQSLSSFWNPDVTENINSVIKKNESKYLFNLSSNEYFQSIDESKIIKPIITPVFTKKENGHLKSIGMLAKKCRGAMARMIIKKEIKNCDDLKAFNQFGFKYESTAKKTNKMFFVKSNG